MADFREDTKAGYEFKTQDEGSSLEAAQGAKKDPPPSADSAAVTTEVDPLLGSIIGNRYRIARLLGKGNMARVYVAEQLSMQRNVAVKVLQPKLVVDDVAAARFRQEVDAVCRLQSPHAIRFYDVGRTQDGSPYIVMELLAGETLKDRLDREKRLPLNQVYTITAQIAAALDEAHEAGVWHRDLKPDNVHFCHQATPLQPFLKVLDFGLAKLLDDRGPDNPTLTGRRQTVGTPAYMAPETVVEERVVDHRIDIYALGVMIFEMVTGARPFQESSAMKMVLAHVRAPIPRATEHNPELPPAIDAFFDAVMAKDPEERPNTGSEAVRLLRSSVFPKD